MLSIPWKRLTILLWYRDMKISYFFIFNVLKMKCEIFNRSISHKIHILEIKMVINFLLCANYDGYYAMLEVYMNFSWENICIFQLCHHFHSIRTTYLRIFHRTSLWRYIWNMQEFTKVYLFILVRGRGRVVGGS